MNKLLKILSEVPDNIQNSVIQLFRDNSNVRIGEVGKGIDPDDVATMRNITDVTFEELTLTAFQALVTAKKVIKGKVYNITDNGINEAYGGHKLQIIGKEAVESVEYVIEGLLYNTNVNDYWNTTLNVSTGTYLSFHNPKYNIKCNTKAMFEKLQQGPLGNAALNGRILDCNFNNYTGTLTLDVSNTTLKNCDFSNSSADFDTANLNTNATFSGRILHNFAVPNQTLYPCEFSNTIVINGDGTNNMIARITLVASQTTLDYNNFQSAGIVKLVPDVGSNSIENITNTVIGREYKIISDDVSFLVNIIADVGNITFPVSLGSLSGAIGWSVANSANNEFIYKYNGTKVVTLSKSSIFI